MTFDYKCPLTIVQIGLKTVHTPTHVSFGVLLFADKNCTFKANLLLGKIYV